MRLATLVALTGLVACAPEAPEAIAPAQTGAALSVDYFGDTDVEGFYFYVERVACDAYDYYEWEHYEAVVDLVDGIFPGQIDFIEETLDPSSRHLGADFFVTLSPGCYDVFAVPVTNINGDYYDYSYDCAAVSAEGVVVDPEQTTDVVLVSQCVGDPIGALDTLVLLNHPPELNLEIDEKFNYECEPVLACATITDPDDDPIQVNWDVSPGEFDLIPHDPEIIGFEGGHRIWKACATIITQYTNDYNVNVKVYDMGWEAGVEVRLEDIVQADWTPTTEFPYAPTSHAELNFPIYTNWIEDPLCFDSEGDLGPAKGVYIERWDEANDSGKYCTITDSQEYYCGTIPHANPDVADIQEWLCDTYGNLVEEALYPECENGSHYHGGGH